MTVKELIERLKEFEPDAEVVMEGDGREYCISETEKDSFGNCILT